MCSLLRSIILLSIFNSRSQVLIIPHSSAPTLQAFGRPAVATLSASSRIRPKAFAGAHLRSPGAPKSCSHTGTPPLRSIWQRLPFFKFDRYFEEYHSRQNTLDQRATTHQAFTPGLFRAKLPPALALLRTTGTRPIRTHTPAPAVLPRAQDKPSPLVDFGIRCANPSRIVQRPRPRTCQG
jgi:hypothetical protein